MNLWNKNLLIGIGIGLLLSFLVVSVSLTPKYIEKEARQLGMIYPKELKAQTKKTSSQAEVKKSAYQASDKGQAAQPDSNNQADTSNNQADTGGQTNQSKPVSTSDNQPKPATSQAAINVVIPSGAASSEIAQLLADKGVIKDTKSFLARVSERRVSSKFHSGSYSFVAGEDINSVINKLVKG